MVLRVYVCTLDLPFKTSPKYDILGPSTKAQLIITYWAYNINITYFHLPSFHFNN